MHDSAPAKEYVPIGQGFPLGDSELSLQLYPATQLAEVACNAHECHGPHNKSVVSWQARVQCPSRRSLDSLRLLTLQRDSVMRNTRGFPPLQVKELSSPGKAFPHSAMYSRAVITEKSGMVPDSELEDRSR